MRTLGLIGGMTYHSTVDYYTGINDGVAAALGGHTSAPPRHCPGYGVELVGFLVKTVTRSAPGRGLMTILSQFFHVPGPESGNF